MYENHLNYMLQQIRNINGNVQYNLQENISNPSNLQVFFSAHVENKGYPSITQVTEQAHFCPSH